MILLMEEILRQLEEKEALRFRAEGAEKRLEGKAPLQKQQPFLIPLRNP